MAVLSPDEMRLATSGVILDEMDDAELAVYITNAEDAAATYVNQDSLSYRQVTEVKPWKGENLKFHLLEAPLRTITRYTLLTSVYQGKDIGYDVDATPVAITGSPFTLPSNIGGMKINRTVNGGDATSFLVTAGLGWLLMGSMEPEQEFTYTAGWDDGTVQPDGYSLPYPNWLKTAVRLICVDLLGDWETGQKGMTGLQQMRVANTVFRKPTNRSKDEAEIPPLARKILERHFGIWVAGG